MTFSTASAPSPARRRRVSIVTEAPGLGGVAVHTRGLIAALVDHGLDVEVVWIGADLYGGWVRERGWQDRVTLRQGDPRGFLADPAPGLEPWPGILAGLEGEALVVTKGHFHHVHEDLLRLCRRRFGRIVVVEHLEAPAGPQPRTGALRWVPRLALAWRRRRAGRLRAARLADHVVAVSERVRNRLVQVWGLPAGQVVVARNGVDWRRFRRDAAAGARFRAAHGVAPEAFVFGMLTRLHKVKGVDIALRALREALSPPPRRDPVLVVCGEGDDDAALRALAQELGLAGRVRFPGPVADSAAAVAAFDSILFSSRSEGLPLALLEGMAAGCVPVVTDVGGMREPVSSPDVGWVVPPEDPAALATAMREVLALDDAALAGFRERAAGRIRLEFDDRASYERILRLLGVGAA